MNKRWILLVLCAILTLGTLAGIAHAEVLQAEPSEGLVEAKKAAAITIKLTPTSAILDVGERVLLNYKLSKLTDPPLELVWSVSAPEVASVDNNGYVTAKAPGKAIIGIATADGKISAKMVVRVRGGTMRTLKLSAIGDVVLGGDKKKVPKADRYIHDGLTSYQRFKVLYDQFGEDYFFAKVAGIFHSDGLTVANIEGQITDRTASRNKTVVLSGPSKYSTILSRAGIDLGCLANNHMDDFFTAGRRDTIRNLNAVGVRTYSEGSGNTRVVEADGVRVGFAGFVTPAMRSDVQKAIRNLKRVKKCDVVVVSFHWARSPEWTSAVYADERSLARFAVNCGADLVLGHHKHFVSGIERYKGRMIVYDLGNFLALIRHVTSKGAFVSKDTIIFQQKFNVFEDGYVERVDPNVIPCLSSDSLEKFNGQPRVASGEDAGRILDKLRARTPASSKALVRWIAGY